MVNIRRKGKRRAPDAPRGIRLAATFFLVGEWAPVAPATVVCVVLTPFMYPYLGLPVWIQLVMTALLTWVAIPVSTRAEAFYGHDASPIVIDEVVGMLVTFLMIPMAPTLEGNLLILGIGFFFFRLFDVLKLFPAGWAQELPQGTGIVLDDFFAGIHANLALRVVLLFL